MTFLEWKDEFSIHNSEIDHQHRELVDLLNSLYEAMKTRTLNDVRGSTLNQVIDHARRHFASEEKMMAEKGFPDLQSHKEAHRALMDQIVNLRSRHRSGGLILSNEVLQFLKEWLMGHMQGMDREFGAFMAHDKGKGSPSQVHAPLKHRGAPLKG